MINAQILSNNDKNNHLKKVVEAYCKIVKEICGELNLKSMLEVDSFINGVYWELKEEDK